MRAFGLEKVRGLIRRHTQLAGEFEAMVEEDDRYGQIRCSYLLSVRRSPCFGYNVFSVTSISVVEQREALERNPVPDPFFFPMFFVSDRVCVS